MTKYEIAEMFMQMENLNSEYIDKIPADINSVFFDNEFVYNIQTLLHSLLTQCLGQEDYDDLMYFAYETNPKVIVDNQEFCTLIDYWNYKYSK